MLFDLENGKIIALELTPEVNQMLTALAESGVEWSKGREVSRETPYREEQTE